MFFSDLSGYTAMTEMLEPEQVESIMAQVFDRAEELVARFGGRIVQRLGDAVFAVFGDPLAHEDDAERAVRTVLDLHAHVDSLSPSVEALIGRPISLHSGVNSGMVLATELVAGRDANSLVGDTVNTAARLEGLSEAGEILIGPETRGLVEGVFELIDRGSFALKGKAQPLVVTRVAGLLVRRGVRRVQPSRFVGRQKELSFLLRAVDDLRSGHSGVVTIEAEAGGGKSRLVEEFRALLPDDVAWLEGRAYPFEETTSYAAVIDLISRAFGIRESDPPHAVRAKVCSGVAAVVDEPGVIAPIAYLYGIAIEGAPIDRETFADRLLSALRRILAILAERRPTVVCFEDVHWADPSTQALLNDLLGSLDDLGPAVLAVVNHRTEIPFRVAGGRTLVLDALSPDQIAEVVGSLVETPASIPLVDFVAARSEGNPFFVEEITAALLETGSIDRTPEGAKLRTDFDGSFIPPTVRGVLAGRIDRLDHERRTVIREASVVGREFLYRVVNDVSSAKEPVDASLALLTRADLIRQKAIEPDLEYTFKHALTQEVAYEGLVLGDRKRLHRLIAESIERTLADRLDDVVETLAHHYFRAGDVDHAVHYLRAAGRKSTHRYALVEANHAFDSAYRLLVGIQRTPQQDSALIGLLNEWSLVHYYRDRIDDWMVLLARHVADAERVADPTLTSMYLGWYGNALLFHGDIAQSRVILERALTVGETAGECDGVLHARAWRVHTLGMAGQFREALAFGETIEHRPEDVARNPYPMIKARGGIAYCATAVGDIGRAREEAQLMIAYGQASGNARAEAFGCQQESCWRLYSLDFAGAAAAGQRGLAAARDEVFRASCATYTAFALMSNGDDDAFEAVLDTAFPKYRDLGDFWHGSPLGALDAARAMAHGDLSAGMRSFIASTADARRRGYGYFVLNYEIVAARLHVMTARREVKARLSSIMRNPWFVARHAIPAARIAAWELDRLRAFAQVEAPGFLGLIELSRTELYSHLKRRKDALDALDDLHRFIERTGLEATPTAVTRIEQELAV